MDDDNDIKQPIDQKEQKGISYTDMEDDTPGQLIQRSTTVLGPARGIEQRYSERSDFKGFEDIVSKESVVPPPYTRQYKKLVGDIEKATSLPTSLSEIITDFCTEPQLVIDTVNDSGLHLHEDTRLAENPFLVTSYNGHKIIFMARGNQVVCVDIKNKAIAIHYTYLDADMCSMIASTDRDEVSCLFAVGNTPTDQQESHVIVVINVGEEMKETQTIELKGPEYRITSTHMGKLAYNGPNELLFCTDSRVWVFRRSKKRNSDSNDLFKLVDSDCIELESTRLFKFHAFAVVNSQLIVFLSTNTLVLYDPTKKVVVFDEIINLSPMDVFLIGRIAVSPCRTKIAIACNQNLLISLNLVSYQATFAFLDDYQHGVQFSGDGSFLLYRVYRHGQEVLVARETASLKLTGEITVAPRVADMRVVGDMVIYLHRENPMMGIPAHLDVLRFRSKWWIDVGKC